MPLDLTVPAALLTALLPDLIVMGGAMLLLLWGVWQREGDPSAGRRVAVGAIGVCLAALASIAWLVMRGASTTGGPLAIDNFRWAADVVILFGTMLSIALADDYGRRTTPIAIESHALTLLATSGMMLLAGARDLILVFLGIELMSVAVYVLAGINRRSARSAEAALKYFLLGAFSTAFLLYGVALVYGATGATNLARIGAAVTAVPAGAGSMLVIGLALMLIGFAFKVSAAPFHMWTPDVYEGAPTPIVAFFTTAPKLAALVAFARLLFEAFPGAYDEWRQVVLIISMASMAVGAFGGLAQKNLKRLLAYSSIANMGYALLAISAGTGQGVQALLIMMVVYMIESVGLFACLAALNRGGRPMETIGDFAGLSRVRPGMAIAVTVLALSIAGIPPGGGFWGKYVYVFNAAIDAELWGPAVFGLLTGVVAAFYYLRLVKTIWFDPAPGEVDATPLDARWIAYASAIFAFPAVYVALPFLEPYAARAAQSFGLG